MLAVNGCIVDRAVLAFALLEGVAQHLVIGISIIYHRLSAFTALNSGLGEQALLIEQEHVITPSAVGHDHLLVNTARAAVKAQIQVLDAVTMGGIIHQIGIEKL